MKKDKDKFTQPIKITLDKEEKGKKKERGSRDAIQKAAKKIKPKK
jgi:hypothetical protein